MVFYGDAQHNQWTRDRLTEYEPLRIQDQKIGVVGFGVIGRRLCTVLHSLGATVYGVEPLGIPVDLPFVTGCRFEELPFLVDATLLACTHESSTHLMVIWNGLNQCNQMTLINCARGKLVEGFNGIGVC